MTNSAGRARKHSAGRALHMMLRVVEGAVMMWHSANGRVARKHSLLVYAAPLCCETHCA